MKFSSDGKIIAATAQRDSKFLIIDAITGKIIKKIPRSSGEVSSIAIANDNSSLVYALKKASIVFTNIVGTSENKMAINSKKTYEHIRISHDNCCVIAGDSLGNISIYETMSGKLLSRFQANKGWIVDMAISIDSSIGISAGPGNELNVWKIPCQCKVKTE